VYRTVVVEDSEIGLAAARAAGMACIVTKSSYTVDEDFTGASRVVDELGDGQGAVRLEELRTLALAKGA
jgi:beta-phosphoglucomutase-like phosphatase (HAD superfamily)